MIVLMLMTVALVAGLCVLAYTLAVYALPFMLGVEVARWAYASGSGLIGAGLVGLVAGAAAYGLLIVLFMTVRPPILRLAVALVFAACRRCGLCTGSRHHARGRAVRGLAHDLLPDRRRRDRRVGADAAGGRYRRQLCLNSSSNHISAS